jgi:PAS domain S-box-containing protein
LTLTGYTREEILDRTLEELKLEIGIGNYEKIVEKLQPLVPVRNHEFTLRTKSGETRVVLLSIEAIELEGIDCTLNIFHDITEYKRLENQFISLVSHELRTPMNSLIGSLDLLKTGQLGTFTDRGRKILDIAIANTERSIRLVNDILDLERIKAGKLSLERTERDISEIILSSIESVRSLADRAGISLHYEGVSVTLPVDGDRLIQALTNLLGNAIKFSEPGQTVRTRAEMRGEYLQIEVQDNGRGIPGEYLARIFEPFQQVDASDSRQKGGTGLGLAICRDIIDRHDGRIWVESVLGAGSTFYIHLPLNSHE